MTKHARTKILLINQLVFQMDHSGFLAKIRNFTDIIIISRTETISANQNVQEFQFRSEYPSAIWTIHQKSQYTQVVRDLFSLTAKVIGNANLITDDTGAVIERFEFYPFGLIRYEQRDDFQSPYRFAGKELDTESGLYYFEARYYLPLVGKFISVDPLEGKLDDPQSSHGYAYCNNNPIIYIDLTGMDRLRVLIILIIFDDILNRI